jgi:hypothetical protein
MAIDSNMNTLSLDRRKQGGNVFRCSTVTKFRVVFGCFLTLLSMCCVSVLTIIGRQEQQHHRNDHNTGGAGSWQDSFVISSSASASSWSQSASSTMLESKHSQQQLQSSSSSSSAARLATIDILSIGSVLRPELQRAQRETMASHASIRHFFAMTEHNDTSEPNCHVDLTMSHVRRVVNFCRRPGQNNNNIIQQQQQHYHLEKMRQHYATLKWLTKKSNPAGWLCAQKRPIDAFRQIMSAYEQQQQQQQQPEHSFPDYLLIIDDDTYMNINSIVDFLPRQNGAASSTIPALAIAGCRIRSRIYEHNMTIPFGGMGVILSRQTLQNFATPVSCPNINNDDTIPTTTTNTSSSDFERLACWRLAQNGAGERPLFKQGMSLVELMHAYTTASPYMHADRWNKEQDGGGVRKSADKSGENEVEGGVGYCMHSDWMWGYFINVYPVSTQTSDVPFFADVFEDRLQGYNGSTIYAGRKSPESNAQLKQCRHKNVIDNDGNSDSERRACPPESHICHRLSERRMRELYQQQQQLLQ